MGSPLYVLPVQERPHDATNEDVGQPDDDRGRDNDAQDRSREAQVRAQIQLAAPWRSDPEIERCHTDSLPPARVIPLADMARPLGRGTEGPRKWTDVVSPAPE